MKEITFTLNNNNYKLRLPTADEQNESQLVYNRAFTKSLTSGAMLRDTAANVLRAQGLWNDEKEADMDRVAKEIREKELVLHRGGIKLSDARVLALQIKKLRNDYARIILPLSSFNMNHTAEGQADNARFNYLLSCCLVYENGERVFKTVQEYEESDNVELVSTAGSKFASLNNNLAEDFESTLPENKFLKEWKFVDDSGRLINKEGHLITEDGRLINDKGELVDTNGNRIDIDGNPIDDEGNLLIESQPFLDDDGNPIDSQDSNKDSTKSKSKKTA